ncbi:phenylacetate-CoA oxygenase subunit PaaJ [bacterium]|nr:phenylacetate-CoA oxygenase subunit PaaJ [bacterium]
MNSGLTERVLAVLETVSDPEIPVLSVIDLGIIRSVSVSEADHSIHIDLSPTYSGCPAMDTIEADIRSALTSAGFGSIHVRTVLEPAWTTDWMSESGKRKLEAYGIAPPEKRSGDKRALFGKAPEVRCPLCKSTRTTRLSAFGSTPCKALYRCDECLEPFDAFKCI